MWIIFRIYEDNSFLTTVFLIIFSKISFQFESICAPSGGRSRLDHLILHVHYLRADTFCGQVRLFNVYKIKLTIKFTVDGNNSQIIKSKSDAILIYSNTHKYTQANQGSFFCQKQLVAGFRFTLKHEEDNSLASNITRLLHLLEQQSHFSSCVACLWVSLFNLKHGSNNSKQKCGLQCLWAMY